MQKFNYQKSNKATGKIYIGLDHGYGNIKTAHRVFQTGIECYDEEPIVSTNYVKYRDKYYVIGESHLVYQGNKTESDDFYILTLAGLAEEMKYRGLHWKYMFDLKEVINESGVYCVSITVHQDGKSAFLINSLSVENKEYIFAKDSMEKDY